MICVIHRKKEYGKKKWNVLKRLEKKRKEIPT